MIKGCIFDADGTLLDSMQIWDDLGQRYLLTQGIQSDRSLNQILFPMTLAESSAYLKKHYLPDLSEKEIQNGFMNLIRQDYAERIPAKKGAPALIRSLHEERMPMMVATISDADMIRTALKRLDILDCFMDVFDTVSLHTDKSHPDIYLKCAGRMGTLPAETAVFEDTLEPLCTAQKAGFRTAAIEDESSCSDRQAIKNTADLYVHDFTETDQLKRWMNS